MELFSSLKRTLEEVTELKNLMDDVFSSIVSGVITADVRDQIILCNRAACSILGQASAEMVGRPLGEIMPAFAKDSEAASQVVRLPVSISAGLMAISLALSLVAGGLASYFMGRRTANLLFFFFQGTITFFY